MTTTDVELDRADAAANARIAALIDRISTNLARNGTNLDRHERQVAATRAAAEATKRFAALGHLTVVGQEPVDDAPLATVIPFLRG
jgi:hypothetical protein